METFESYKKNFDKRFFDVQKEIDFFNFLKSSNISVNKLNGEFGRGFEIYSPDYALMEEFKFIKTDYKKSTFDHGYDEPLEISSEEYSFRIIFFSNPKPFPEATIFLDEEEMKKKEMEVLYHYFWNKSRGDSFSFPNESQEINDFFISKKMNENLVERLVRDVELTRGVLF
ncbi:MAG: hypothetical protein Q8Q04_00610 [archaeon]|nr:hypothetical protein [archaeon]